MTQAQRRVLLALGGLVAAVAVALLLTRGGDGGPEVAAGGTTTSSSSSVVPTSTTSTTAPSTSTSPTTSTVPAATTTTAAPRPSNPSTAPVVTADGALLRPPVATRDRQLPPGGGCADLADPAFAVDDCGTADARGGRLAWLVERGPAGARRVVVFRREGGRTWRPVLEMDDPRGQVAAVGVRVVDLSGDRSEEIAFGFRLGGSGSILSVDVVDGGEVVFHRDLEQGSVRVSPGQFDEWSARFAPGDANCCPSAFTHGVVRFAAGAWRLVAQTAEPPPPPPSHL